MLKQTGKLASVSLSPLLTDDGFWMVGLPDSRIEYPLN